MEQQIAIVTGASKGIGRAIAEEFAANGKYVALISRNSEQLEQVVKELNERGRLCSAYQCDVSDSNQVIDTFDRISRELGGIDILVNNAGINSRRTIPKNNEDWLVNFRANLEGWNKELATNLSGVYVCSYIGSSHMLKKGQGIIINVSSIKGKEPTTSPGYGSSKAGVIKLTKDFAKALAPKIRVNCIAPGFIDTGMTSELPEDKKESYRKIIPLARFGSTQEIAKVAAFLASENASYITGATIDVNGGYLMD